MRAALARLDARLKAPALPPTRRTIRWEYPRSAERCFWCKRSVLKTRLLYKVRTTPTFTYGHNGPTGGERVMHAQCQDSEDCAAYRERRYEVRRRRSGVMFVIVKPPYEGESRGRGFCKWCGEQIVLVNPEEDYRCLAREYHRGDEPEVGERNCLTEWRLSRTDEPRIAIVRRDLLDHGHVFCADCGLVCVELVHGMRSRYGQDAYERPDSHWEADHRVALEDGGEHALENLQCLCVPCHRRKTARENRARAEQRAKVRA